MQVFQHSNSLSAETELPIGSKAQGKQKHGETLIQTMFPSIPSNTVAVLPYFVDSSSSSSSSSTFLWEDVQLLFMVRF